MNARVFFSVGVLFAACKSREHASARAVDDPVVASSSSPAPTPPPAPPADSLVFFYGDVIDLASARLVVSLATDAHVGAIRNGTAYVATEGGELAAYDVHGGPPRWKIRAVCDDMAALDRGVVCADETKATLHPSDGGAPVSLPTPTAADIQAFARIRDRIAILRAGGAVDVFDDTGTLRGSLPSSTLALDAGGYEFSSVGDHACTAAIAGDDLEVSCLDPSAPAVRSTKFALGKPSDPPSLTYSIRFATPRLVVATKSERTSAGRGIVVDLATTTEVARVEQNIAGVISDADGAFVSIVTFDASGKRDAIAASAGHPASTISVAAPWHEVSGVAFGDTLVLATFHPIASIADLHGYDVATGVERWIGDLARLPIPHSQYLNDVVVTAAFGHVVVHGVESAQVYLELFDPKTGANLLRDVKAS